MDRHRRRLCGRRAGGEPQACSVVFTRDRRGLQDHPTVKPTAMLEDALLDLTNRAEIVIDPFLGSGSSLIAADKTGRICRGVEARSAVCRCDRPPLRSRYGQ
jgi:DNA modification methylase